MERIDKSGHHRHQTELNIVITSLYTMSLTTLLVVNELVNSYHLCSCTSCQNRQLDSSN